MTTELKFGSSFINFSKEYKPTPFEIVLGDKYFGNQQLTNSEAKQIADFIYESLGIKEKPILHINAITEDEKKELMKAFEESGKSLAHITLIKPKTEATWESIGTKNDTN